METLAPPPDLRKPREVWEDALGRCGGDEKAAAGLARRWRESMGENLSWGGTSLPFYVQPLALNAQDVVKIQMCEGEETYGLVDFIAEGGTTTAHDTAENIARFLMDVGKCGFFVADLVARQIRDSNSSAGLREAILEYLGDCDDGPYSDIRAFGFDGVKRYMMHIFLEEGADGRGSDA